MKRSFHQHLMINEVGGDLLKEENLLDILTFVKGKLTKYLTLAEENVLKPEEEKKFFDYLKFVAIFEQFFRFLDGHQIGLEEIPGINTFVNNEHLDELDEIKLARKVDEIVKRFTENHSINFKSIAERRFNEFTKWFKDKRKDDLEIITGSIDYISKTIKEFNRKLASLSADQRVVA